MAEVAGALPKNKRSNAAVEQTLWLAGLLVLNLPDEGEVGQRAAVVAGRPLVDGWSVLRVFSGDEPRPIAVAWAFEILDAGNFVIRDDIQPVVISDGHNTGRAKILGVGS